LIFNKFFTIDLLQQISRKYSKKVVPEDVKKVHKTLNFLTFYELFKY